MDVSFLTLHFCQIVHLSWIYPDNWMLVMSTQLIGFSIGGIARRFLVTPPSMSTSAVFPSLSSVLTLTLRPVWPNSLVTCALFNTLHSQTYPGMGNNAHGGLSRERFFAYAFVSSAVWCKFSAHPRVHFVLITMWNVRLISRVFVSSPEVSTPSL